MPYIQPKWIVEFHVNYRSGRKAIERCSRQAERSIRGALEKMQAAGYVSSFKVRFVEAA